MPLRPVTDPELLAQLNSDAQPAERTFLVTSPDGRRFRVKGRGTQDEALAYVQSQYRNLRPVTDPELLAQLNSPNPDGRAQDPAVAADIAANNRALIDETENPWLVAIGRGMLDTGQGLKQLAYKAADAADKNPFGPGMSALLSRFGLGRDARQAAEQKYTRGVMNDLGEYEKLADAHPVQSFLGRGLGNVVTTPIPGAGQGATVAARMGSSALANAAASGVQFVPEGESRLLNMGLGGIFGAGGQLLGEGLGRFGRKIINTFTRQGMDDTARTVIEAGEKANVPVYFDDVTQSANAKRAGQLAEHVPVVGTGGGRAAQAQAAQEAVERKLVELKADGLSDDYFGEIQSSLKANLRSLKQTAKSLYDRAEQALDPLGEVPVDSFRKTLRQGISSELEKGSLADTGLIAKLQKYLDSPQLQSSEIVMEGAKVSERAAKFSDLRRLRSDLGDEIADYYKGRNAAIGAKGVAILQRAKEALDSDLAAFVSKAGDKGKAWREADRFYREKLVPFKSTALKNLVNSPEPEKAWRYLVSSGGLGSRSRQLYEALNEKGRAAVRYGLAKEAFDRATADNRPFSPGRFASYLENMKEPVETFFRGTDKAEIDGLTKLMRHIERAGAYMENPPTGQRVVSAAMAASVFNPATLKAATALAGSAGGIRLLFQTQVGRDFLLASSKAQPGTAKFDKLLHNIVLHFTRAGALTAAQPEAAPAAMPGGMGAPIAAPALGAPIAAPAEAPPLDREYQNQQAVVGIDWR